VTALDQITQAAYTYARAYDEEDMDLFAQVFVEDAEFVLPEGTVLAGRDAIRAEFAERRAGRRERGELSRHLTTNVLVLEESELEATVSAYFMTWNFRDGRVESSALGTYLDTWTNDGGSWRIKRRQMRLDGLG
jgi:uncharacterized protein (TIGR02246 family)